MLKHHIIQYIIMIMVGMAFNPMNLLAFRFRDLYLSLTLFYGGLVMAANMIWAHEIVHYLSHGKFNINIFFIGITLTFLITIFLLRKQFMVDDKQYLRRMISHHSTALTTSHNILNKTKNQKLKRLAKDIIDTQEREITLMKNMLI